MSLIIVSQIHVKIWEASGMKIGGIKFLPFSRRFFLSTSHIAPIKRILLPNIQFHYRSHFSTTRIHYKEAFCSCVDSNVKWIHGHLNHMRVHSYKYSVKDNLMFYLYHLYFQNIWNDYLSRPISELKVFPYEQGNPIEGMCIWGRFSRRKLVNILQDTKISSYIIL